MTPLENLIAIQCQETRLRIGAALVALYPGTISGDERFDLWAGLRNAIEAYVEGWVEDNVTRTEEETRR